MVKIFKNSVLFFLFPMLYANAQTDCMKFIKVQGEVKGYIVTQDNCTGRVGQIAFSSDEAMHAFIDTAEIIISDGFIENSFLGSLITYDRSASLCDCEEERDSLMNHNYTLKKQILETINYNRSEINRKQDDDRFAETSHFESLIWHNRLFGYLHYKQSVIRKAECIRLNLIGSSCILNLPIWDSFLEYEINSDF